MNAEGDAGQRISLLDEGVSRVGEVLADKYRLVRKLGEGGMGAVYEAHHTFVGRRFAVKFLHPELARDKEILGRFQREAQAAGSLENENIVAVTDFGFAADHAPYIVMEYLEGDDLRALLTREVQLPSQRIVNIVIQACRGLHAAHGRDIVHRDLKPENLFIARRGEGTDLVKILDFGVAKLRGQTVSGVSTRAGTVMGTLHYMPIEQIRGDKDIDQRADIYALGAILYEALSGTVPHPGQDPTSIIYHIMNEPVVPLDSLRPGQPEGLSQVVHKSLASNADERFQSVADLAQALTPFAGRQVTPFNSKVALAVGSGEVKTVRTPVSDVQPPATGSSPTAPGQGEHTEAQQPPVAPGAISSATHRRRIPKTVGVVGVLALALAFVVTALVVWAEGRKKEEIGHQRRHLVMPAREESASAAESDKGPSGLAAGHAKTLEVLQQGPKEASGSNRDEPSRAESGEDDEKPTSGRPPTASGRPGGQQFEHPSPATRFGHSAVPARPARTTRAVRRGQKVKEKGIDGPASRSITQPESASSEQQPSFIERRRRNRKLRFITESPYE